MRFHSVILEKAPHMREKIKEALALPRAHIMSARNADVILDHLSSMVSETGRYGGRIKRIHGMDLRYWTGRINTVIDQTILFSPQQERAKRLLAKLVSSDRE
ncbi:hypothetical protein [Burkholderia sp. PAMC 26561]|jgi:Mg2+ and Co2+ transporter CorA|uniref:hypothetical protein n=1 Tax=Burkholderia sp. PAMC 26561 TaxID=1795043 RepID=UPI0013C3FC72|nr:hypothetical protein [Burkholderia sp. PAMC 26561]